MGLFGLGKKAEINSPESALMLACYTMLFTEDNAETDKLMMLQNINSSGKDLFKSPHYKNAEKFFKNHSFEECAEAIADELLQEERETVFVNLVDFALADGDINETERQLLALYSSHFDIDEDIFDKILDIMFMKHRMSV